MKKNANRYDTNRKIKQILVSHGTNLSKIFFSFSGKTARFSGRFLKTSGQEMKLEEMETLCRAMAGIAGIRFLNFDMDNWAIAAGMGSLNIVKKSVPSSTGSNVKKTIHIDSSESVEEVIKDEFGGT